MPLLDAYSEFQQQLPHLPLILAGPILRRTDPDGVTVWLALKAPSWVTLRVYTTIDGQGKSLDQERLSGSRATVAVGKYLHIVAVTAKPVDGYLLEPGQIYAYDLEFGDRNQTLNDALNAREVFPFITISYLDHNLPTFAMPPDDLNHLRIVHGSCRKVHGKGQDALPLLDGLIEESAAQPHCRPHQLFLTGDQIYGDDVADPLLAALGDVGTTLLGWEEEIPYKGDFVKGYSQKKVSEWKPGQRTEIAHKYAGLTAMLDNQPERAKSHLFSLGEYLAMYLFYWSPILWVHPFAKGKIRGKKPKTWDKEVKAIQEFASRLWQVRRSLANIPTYMIFDDHDVSDDWYLNREWCNRVLGKPLGRRVVQNGLLAYALCQGWGNTPEQFTSGQPGDKLWQALQQWSESAGTDELAWERMGKYLGIPAIEAETGLPKLKQDGTVLVLNRDYADGTPSLIWHYSVRSFKHEVIVLDTRTWRGYPMGEDQVMAPPMLLSPTAFDEQIEDSLDKTDQLKAAGESRIEATLIVLPTNLIHASIVDLAQQWYWRQGKVFGTDVGDSWNFHDVAFTKLLTALFQRRDRIVLLSGDIHYGSVVRLNYWSHPCGELQRHPEGYIWEAEEDCKDEPSRVKEAQESQNPKSASVLVQLTSSAIKNAEFKTYLVHTKVKSLLLEQPQYWVGWEKSPQLLEIITTPDKVRIQDLPVPGEGPFWQQIQVPQGNWDIAWQVALKDERSQPDWRYRTEWSKRQKAESVPWLKRHPQPELHQKSPLWQKVLLGSISWLWRNRWLQEGEEIIGCNNISVVRFHWSPDEDKAVIQEMYWHPPWKPTSVVKSRYLAPLRLESPPPLPTY
ncbi:PhoD-like phosphatase [Coleofasciculus sp. G2-EDA-02]|uniref:PhoD-like phosphatase n=1 Tax=Coleofasciculus sp. G2-EDA-02 TaxID=3069529 RepID=UPI0032F9F6B3